MKTSHILLLVLTLVTVAALAFAFNLRSPDSVNSPRSGDEFRLEYVETGGIAGFNRNFTIETDGARAIPSLSNFPFKMV